MPCEVHFWYCFICETIFSVNLWIYSAPNGKFASKFTMLYFLPSFCPNFGLFAPFGAPATYISIEFNSDFGAGIGWFVLMSGWPSGLRLQYQIYCNQKPVGYSVRGFESLLWQFPFLSLPSITRQQVKDEFLNKHRSVHFSSILFA